ncbi:MULTISPECIES: hypothetical protein [Streptomyces]|uniref:hypothetical protein n=1 Tax=Streptomyces TaxID=1883 RepID=UPI00093D0FF4|nr:MULTISPECIES: hypothetical protein [unclassified Streptomyces]QNQ35652.1 hypothetical protein HYC88_19525 [Streptomyces sp. CB00271]
MPSSTVDTPVGTLLRQLVIATGAENVVLCGGGPADGAGGGPEGDFGEALRLYGRGRVVRCDAGAVSHEVPSFPGPVDLLVLDGPPGSFLSVLRRWEPRMLPGAMVVACGGAGGAADFLDHVRAAENGYISLPLPFDGAPELAVRSS